ncbi:hypothetical protein J6590_042707 [Homalodisca vitripennis]|nr:hypothetical protein J6590_042707 [Homalodisca vitripennis]
MVFEYKVGFEYTAFGSPITGLRGSSGCRSSGVWGGLSVNYRANGQIKPLPNSALPFVAKVEQEH